MALEVRGTAPTGVGAPDEWAAYLADAVPVPETAGLLGHLDANRLSPAGRIDALRALERHMEWIQALQVRVLAAVEAEPVDPFPGEDTPSEGVWDFTCEQVACALRVSNTTAATRLSTARELAATFPATLGLLESGRIHYMQAHAVVEVTGHLPRQTASRVEALVTDRMPVQAVSATRKALHRALIKADPHGAQERHRAARAERRICHRMAQDGMAWWSAYLPAEHAAQLDAAVDTHARNIHGGPEGRRTLAQRRVDALIDLVLNSYPRLHQTLQPAAVPVPLAGTGALDDGKGRDVPFGRTTGSYSHQDWGVPFTKTPDPDGGEGRGLPFDRLTDPGGHQGWGVPFTGTADPNGGEGRGVPFTGTADPDGGVARGVPFTGTVGRSAPVVQVTVSLETLIGVDDQPADLKGYGPITAAQARALATAPGSVWRRLITHPATGMLVKTDPTTYRPTAETIRHVIARDGHCAFPSCRMPAHRCDLDHVRPFDHHAPATGGPTTPDNLVPLCRRHHLLKHRTGWTAERDPATGHTTWTAPTGHTYTNAPHAYVA